MGKTKKIDPVAGTMAGCPYAMISHFGRTYVVLPDDRVVEPASQQVVGVFNKDTNEIEPVDPMDYIISENDPGPMGMFDSGGGHVTIKEPDRYPDSDNEDAPTLLEKAQSKLKLRRYKTGALIFGQALKAAQNSPAIDLDVEIDILRGRSKCWEHLKDHQQLLDDVERLLKISSDDREAEEWKQAALKALGRSA